MIEDEGGVLGDERRRMEIKVFDDKEGENSGDDMNKGKLGNKGEDVTKNKGVDEGVDSGGDDENIGKMDVGDVEKEVVREKKGGVKRNKVNFEEIELRRSQRERKLVMQTGFDEELDEYFPEDDRSTQLRYLVEQLSSSFIVALCNMLWVMPLLSSWALLAKLGKSWHRDKYA